MPFISQSENSKLSSRRGDGAQVVITQSYKPSTKSQELSLRVSSELLKNIGMKIGDNADVLHDPDTGEWMIKKSENGFKVTGKSDAPTGLIRYTLKKGHMKFTEDKGHLPIKKISGDDSIRFHGDYVIFTLAQRGN